MSTCQVSETKHTPGPWKYEPVTGAILRSDTDGFVLAQVTGYDAEDDEEEGNALLMAASPELANGCKAALAWLENMKPTASRTGLRAILVAALQKAGRP